MPTAAKTTTTPKPLAPALSRRGLLAGATVALAATDAALALAKGASPAGTLPASPDAALVAACAEFEEAHRRLIAIYDGETAIADDAEAERAADPLRARLVGLVDAMDGMSAKTEAGLRARIRLMSVYNGNDAWSWDDESTISGKLLRQVMRDGGAALPVAAINEHPDSELIAVAAEAERLEGEYGRLCWATDTQDPRYNTPLRRTAEVEFEAVQSTQNAALERLADMHPATLAGMRAKARAVQAWYGNIPPDTESVAGPALWSLVTDLAGEGGAA